MSIFKLPSPIQQLNSSFLKEKQIDLWIKRDDLIHSEVSGNKWRKLKHNIEQAKHLGFRKVLTFGGAYSNHIAATAAAGNILGIETIGVIRGEEGFDNDTLSLAKRNGIHLYFVSRSDYKRKTEKEFIDQLEKQFGNFYLVPEGGANDFGVKGCEEILLEVEGEFDCVVCAAGTGTTAAGLCRSLGKEKLLVFPALKGAGFILDEMRNYCSEEQLIQVELQLNYHFGGYAKTKPELIAFYKEFLDEFNIELDLIYTSKMMFGLFDLIRRDYFKRGTKVLAIHTGGVQGNQGVLARF